MQEVNLSYIEAHVCPGFYGDLFLVAFILGPYIEHLKG